MNEKEFKDWATAVRKQRHRAEATEEQVQELGTALKSTQAEVERLTSENNILAESCKEYASRLKQTEADRDRWKAWAERLEGICRMLVDAEEYNLTTLLENAIDAARAALKDKECICVNEATSRNCPVHGNGK